MNILDFPIPNYFVIPLLLNLQFPQPHLEIIVEHVLQGIIATRVLALMPRRWFGRRQLRDFWVLVKGDGKMILLLAFFHE